MSTHTKAPWTLEEHTDEPCQLIGNGTIHIADIFCTDFPAGAADARLIAAAPELLAACQRSIELLKACGANVDANEPILKAIAKAVQS